ncbi:MAG: D-sedoheptulose 7-phosphate isomerase [Candidatus Pacebacteria bacterium]|nr:D-sedoheptulose 7-phosphate isomerase [Candidatus Paceibacterota bacterium]
MDKIFLINKAIKDSHETKSKILGNKEILSMIETIAEEMIKAFKNGRKVLFCGNGGSAADAQHLAAELSGKYYLDRDPLPAEPLNINTSFMTAVANDISYKEVFARLIKAVGQSGDILIALSTSGNSMNVIRAVETANDKKMITIGLTGESGGKMQSLCQHLIKVPSSDTPRIQEAHTLIGHILCDIVEKEIFGEKDVKES